MKIYLCSNSPRRRELLSALNIPFEVKIVDGIDESFPHNISTDKVAEFIAQKKVEAYDVGADELIITADTIVVVDNEILGKPRNEQEAVKMLKQLSGKTHQVITGVCVKTNKKTRVFSVKTDVTLKKLNSDEISYYVSRFKPLDKAGAYGIQEWIGYIGVTSISGSFFNVVGLPVQRIYDVLTTDFGVHLYS